VETGALLMGTGTLLMGTVALLMRLLGAGSILIFEKLTFLCVGGISTRTEEKRSKMSKCNIRLYWKYVCKIM
jgi:hypothetical protein